ncbi:hypothetical protein BH10ACI1_BH10ACI1_16920 [soil metagenome]
MNYRIERWKEMHLPNAAMLRYILVQEGYNVFQWSDQPEKIHAKHQHSQDQTHWIISGAMEITIERVGTFVLEAGDRDFMPANTYHTVRVVGEEQVIYLIGEKL